MKREILLVGLVCMMFLVSGCTEGVNTEQTAQETTNFPTYTSSSEGIRIKYPPTWTKTEQFMGVIVIFSSPLESDSDDFSENLGVIVEDLSTQPVTLEEYNELAIELLEKVITDINILDSTTTTLDGNPAHKIVYTGQQGQYNLKYMQVWTIKNNKAYIITSTSEVNKYSDYLGTINGMINSFEIIS